MLSLFALFFARRRMCPLKEVTLLGVYWIRVEIRTGWRGPFKTDETRHRGLVLYGRLEGIGVAVGSVTLCFFRK